jgi:hypothetical protein
VKLAGKLAGKLAENLAGKLAADEKKGAEMARFMLLHYGFEKPGPEVMAAWQGWFDSIADCTLDQGAHFARGVEIGRAETGGVEAGRAETDGVEIGRAKAGGVESDRNRRQDLPLGPDSITGYTIISADSLAEAEDIAARNPFIKAIRVYEMK